MRAPVRLVIVFVALVALVAASAASAWTWPVEGPVLRPFSFGSDPYAAGQHRGIDIGAPTGTPMVAPAQGTVSFAGTVPTGGKTVTIQTPDGYAVTLVHLGSYEVSRGTVVAEGDRIGTVGPSGVPALAVPYVYLGIRRSADPQGYLDPLLFLPQPEDAPVGPPATGDPAPPGASAPAAVPAPAGTEAADDSVAPGPEARAPAAAAEASATKGRAGRGHASSAGADAATETEAHAGARAG